jgi:archaellum component FlaC
VIQSMESRMGRIEGTYEQVADRLNSIDARFNAIDLRFNAVDARFDSVDARFNRLESKVDRYFLWTVGLIVVSILLPIATRLVTHT